VCHWCCCCNRHDEAQGEGEFRVAHRRLAGRGGKEGPTSCAAVTHLLGGWPLGVEEFNFEISESVYPIWVGPKSPLENTRLFAKENGFMIK
jgi:hypothetical protein